MSSSPTEDTVSEVETSRLESLLVALKTQPGQHAARELAVTYYEGSAAWRYGSILELWSHVIARTAVGEVC